MLIYLNFTLTGTTGLSKFTTLSPSLLKTKKSNLMVDYVRLPVCASTLTLSYCRLPGNNLKDSNNLTCVLFQFYSNYYQYYTLYVYIMYRNSLIEISVVLHCILVK